MFQWEHPTSTLTLLQIKLIKLPLIHCFGCGWRIRKSFPYYLSISFAWYFSRTNLILFIQKAVPGSFGNNIDTHEFCLEVAFWSVSSSSIVIQTIPTLRLFRMRFINKLPNNPMTPSVSLHDGNNRPEIKPHCVISSVMKWKRIYVYVQFSSVQFGRWWLPRFTWVLFWLIFAIYFDELMNTI